MAIRHPARWSALLAAALLTSACGSSSTNDTAGAPTPPQSPAPTSMKTSVPTSMPTSRSTAEAPDPQADRILAAHGLQGLDAVTLIERLDALAVTARPADLMASVRPTELLVSDRSGEPVSVPIPGDRFYLSMAPYAQQTHDCHFHSLTTCLGELRNTKVHVTVQRADTGETLVDQDLTTFDNGFVGVWLPRDIDASVRITHDGRTATRTVRPGAQDATCLTTVKLA